MADLVSTRVQLQRAADLDRDDALAYRWRTTTTRRRGRRSWTEGVLFADQTEGVTHDGPAVEGVTTAISVLAGVRQLAGQLPVKVDLRFDRTQAGPADDWRGPWTRRSRYDRPDRRGETLGERAARLRQQDDTTG